MDRNLVFVWEISFDLFILAVLGFELRASHLLNRHSWCLSHSASLFFCFYKLINFDHTQSKLCNKYVNKASLLSIVCCCSSSSMQILFWYTSVYYGPSWASKNIWLLALSLSPLQQWAQSCGHLPLHGSFYLIISTLLPLLDYEQVEDRNKFFIFELLASGPVSST
jgi:hypothetical protein